MRMAIVVEGPTDIPAYRALIRRIRDGIDDIPAEHCGGRVKTKFVGFLRRFHANPARPVDKALVICDSDCHEPAELEEKLKSVLKASKFRETFPVHFFATKCMIETWLLADENAINTVAARRAKNPSVQPLQVSLEQARNAKDLFYRALSQADLRPVPRIYGEIAEAADLNRVAMRCRYFRHFMEIVLAC